MKYPKKYIPEALRPVPEEESRKLAFGVAVQSSEFEFGFTDGPFFKLRDALEVIPKKLEAQKSVIVRFNTNNTEVIIYRWGDDCWEFHPEDTQSLNKEGEMGEEKKEAEDAKEPEEGEEKVSTDEAAELVEKAEAEGEKESTTEGTDEAVEEATEPADEPLDEKKEEKDEDDE